MVLKAARKYWEIGLKVTGTLMLNFINPKLAEFSLGLVTVCMTNYHAMYKTRVKL